MGKNKGGNSKGKKLSVFKVAGAKSLKLKAKAKPVTGNLKKINELVRKNVTEIDKQLVDLQSDISKKSPPKKNQTNKSKVTAKSPPVSEQEQSETLQKLSDMQF